MSAHNYAALFERIHPDWSLLEIGEAVPGLSAEAKLSIQATVDSLPDSGNSFDLITCRSAIRAAPNAFALLSACAQLLKTKGWLWIEDLHVPDPPLAARYISAFYRWHASAPRRYYAEYEWRGLLLDAGLHIDQLETSHEEIGFAGWTAACSAYTTERLEILLKQAPDAVRDWLQPHAIGTAQASFRQWSIRILARKPD
jgi:hypothetical protein